VQAVDCVSDDPANAGAMAMTWEITAVDAATRVGIRVEHVPLRSLRRITPVAQLLARSRGRRG
jgi:hypothetical protein